MEHGGSFLGWASLFIEHLIYSSVISVAILLIAAMLAQLAKPWIDMASMPAFLAGDRIPAVILLGLATAIAVGLLGYLAGVTAAHSRETGAPAILGALVPVVLGLILYFKNNDAKAYLAAVVVAVLFMVNLSGGLHIGATLRVAATESLEAKKWQSRIEVRSEVYERNLRRAFRLDPRPGD